MAAAFRSPSVRRPQKMWSMRVPGPGQRTARTGEMSGGPFLGPSTTCAEMCGGVRVGSEEGDEGGGREGEIRRWFWGEGGRKRGERETASLAVRKSS